MSSIGKPSEEEVRHWADMYYGHNGVEPMTYEAIALEVGTPISRVAHWLRRFPGFIPRDKFNQQLNDSPHRANAKQPASTRSIPKVRLSSPTQGRRRHGRI